MTAQRGTEGNLGYMVAFMDYARDDMSRPAAVPGWTEIDYSTGKSSAGEFWLNQAHLGAMGGQRPPAHRAGDNAGKVKHFNSG